MKARSAISMSNDMRFVFDDIEVPAPGENEVGIKLVASGLCHTDIGGMKGSIGLFPTVFGHEGSGIVESVGPGVTEFKVGDKVAITYSTCGVCDCCKRGDTSNCEKFMPLNFIGTTRKKYKEQTVYNWFGQNSFSTHTVVNVRSLVKVPDNFDVVNAGPYGCGMITGAGAMFGMNPQTDDVAVIFGLGAVGCAALMAAKICGCRTIIAVGGTQWKLDLAKELGATHVVNRRDTPDIAAEIFRIAPQGANVMAECTGKQNMAAEAMKLFASNGKLALVGVYADDIVVPHRAQNKNASVKLVLEGACDNRETMKKLMQYTVEGKFPAEKIMSYYPFEQLEQAIEDLETQKVIKAVIKFDA